MQNYQVAASGGNKDTRYYLSLSMFDQEGVIKKSGIRRYQTRLNLDRKIGNKVNIGANFQFSHSARKPNLVSLEVSTTKVPLWQLRRPCLSITKTVHMPPTALHV